MSYAEPYLAQQAPFLYEEETTFMTRPTNINNWLRVTSHTPPWPEREIEEVYAHGAGRGPNYINDAIKLAMKGEFEAEVITGEFLGFILGIVNTTGTDPYTHVATLLEGMPPSFATQLPFEMNANHLVPEFLGCRANTLTLKADEASGKLTMACEYLATKPVDGGATVETYSVDSTTKPYSFKEGVFSSTSLYAGAVGRLYGFELPMNANLEPDYVGGNEYWPYDLIPGKFSYGEMKATIGLEDDTEWDEVVGAPGTLHDFSYLFTRGASDTLLVAGSGALKGSPPKVDEHNIKADVIIVPRTVTITTVDSIATYPCE